MKRPPLFYAASKLLTNLNILLFDTVVDVVSKKIGLEYEYIIKYDLKKYKHVPILLKLCNKEQYFYNSYYDDDCKFCLRFVVPERIGFSLCIINDCGIDYVSNDTIISTLEGIEKARVAKRNSGLFLSL